MAARKGCRARDHRGYVRVHDCDHDRDYLRDRDHKGSGQLSENVREVYG